jgi:hypothetical protein
MAVVEVFFDPIFFQVEDNISIVWIIRLVLDQC